MLSVARHGFPRKGSGEQGHPQRGSPDSRCSSAVFPSERVDQIKLVTYEKRLRFAGCYTGRQYSVLQVAV